MAAPFVALLIDVSSWYLVKLYHPFAWMTMGAGAMLGLSFGFMWAVSMYQMWIGKTPKAVLERGSAAIG
jgi:presenilin-like A22 family membrane protease